MVGPWIVGLNIVGREIVGPVLESPHEVLTVDPAYRHRG